MAVRRATECDIPALCDLLHELFSQEHEFIPEREHQARGLSMILDNPAVGVILVAQQRDSIVAMVNLLYTVSTAVGGRVALLEDMVVAPQARSAGVGSALLEHAIEYATLQGCRRITLLSDADNTVAQHFYRRHGFEPSSMQVWRRKLDKV